MRVPNIVQLTAVASVAFSTLPTVGAWGAAGEDVVFVQRSKSK
jgi:hypothetical protein